jgi:hypothetical protein
MGYGGGRVVTAGMAAKKLLRNQNTMAAASKKQNTRPAPAKTDRMKLPGVVGVGTTKY